MLPKFFKKFDFNQNMFQNDLCIHVKNISLLIFLKQFLKAFQLYFFKPTDK